MMGPAASPMAGLMVLAVPLMLLVTAFRAVISAARRPGKSARPRAVMLVVVGALSCALLLWAEDILLTRPAGSQAYGAGLFPFILGDLLVWTAIWSAIAAATIALARRFPGAGAD